MSLAPQSEEMADRPAPASPEPPTLAEASPLTTGQFARIVVVALVIITIAAWARVALQSHSECARADTWLVQGDRESAIMAYRHAAEAWAPLSATGPALDALDDIAQDARDQGDIQTELLALRASRSAILAVRTLWVPNGSRLPRLHERIGELMAVQINDPSLAPVYTAQLNEWRSRFPNQWLALAASLLFVAWLVSLPAGIIWATPGAGALNMRRLLAATGISMLLLIGWLTAVYLA